MIYAAIYFLLIGLFAGCLGGLFGVGGGFIFVPAQLFVYSYLGIPLDLQIKLAIETSLAAVVFNTLVSSYSHYKRGGIQFSIIKQFIVGIILGSVAGAILTKISPSHALELFFGVFECLIGAYFIFAPALRETHSLSHINSFITNALGAIIGTISILLGIGGGFFMVPLLAVLKLPLKKAIGSSSLLTFIVSFIGSIVLLFHSLSGVKEPFTIGYLYLPAFIPLALGAIFGAPLGVKLTHTLPTGLLKKIFGALLILLGIVVLLR